MARARNVALFLTTSALFGTSFVAIRAGVADIPPILFAALRFLFGGALLLPVLAFRTESWRPQSRRDWQAIAIASVLVVGAQNAFVNLGAQYIPSVGIAVIFSTLPILTLGVAALFVPTERLSALSIVGIFVGFAGVLLVVQPSPETLFSGDSLGYVLVFVGVSALAFGTVLSQRVAPQLGTLPVTAWGMVLGGLGIYATSLLAGERVSDIVWTQSAIVSLLYLGTAVSVGGYVLYFELIRRIGSNRTTLLAYLDPVIAGVAGFVVICFGFAIIEHRAVRDWVVSR